MRVKKPFLSLQMVVSDERGRLLDLGNVRIIFDGLMEKARNRERERQREEARRMHKLEQAFFEMLRQADPPVEATTTWEEVSERFSSHASFNVTLLQPLSTNSPFLPFLGCVFNYCRQLLSNRKGFACSRTT